MQTFEPLVWWDWFIIVCFFAVTLGIGLYFSRRAVSSLSDYFVAGRKMTWWVAGTSIVATSFAADTPLVISGWMRTIGLERNWFWWGGIMGMMLCTFFYARMWRRSNILTDVELNELRYSGAPAAGLRIFHATFRSLVQNTIVMGWVTLAMTKILDVVLDIPTLVFVKGQFLPQLIAKGIDVASQIDASQILDWPIYGEAVIPAKVTAIVLCFTIAAGYTTISGLWGVMATDVFQFTLAMTGTVILMIAVLMVAQGPKSMVAQATQAVNEGRVQNRASVNRRALEKDKLLGALSKVAGTPPQGSPDFKDVDYARVDRYVASGLFREDPGDDSRLWWSVHGLTEPLIRTRFNAVGVQDQLVLNALVDLWKRAYTVSEAVFTDSDTVQKMLDDGILIRDTSATDRPLNYYRFPDVSLPESSLLAQLDAAGVVNKSEIMAAWRGDRVISASKITSFLPPFDLKGGGLLAVWALVVFLGLQWWAGGEGGGFLSQRLFSCKDEKHSVLAMLWFNLANYVLRPWPWIVVGVASLFLIPDVTAFGEHYDAEHAYVIMLMKYLPVGLKGMMVAALMAAYMSTISTHINFGASYIVNDLYKRFIHPDGSERSYVIVSQVASVFLAILAGVYAFLSDSIATGWLVFFEMMSGAGFALLLRWYWWRINAWSELSAMFSSLTMFALLNYTRVFHGLFGFLGIPEYFIDGDQGYPVRFTLNLAVSTLVWVTVTFLTPPEKEECLVAFYNRVRPAGLWKHIAIKAGHPKHLTVGWLEWASWVLGVSGLFAMIFSLGKACFGMYAQSLGFAVYAAFATIALFMLIGKMDWSSITEDDPPQGETA